MSNSDPQLTGSPLATSTPCPYFCRDGELLVWTVNLPEPSTQPCPACTPHPLILAPRPIRSNGKTVLATYALCGINIDDVDTPELTRPPP